MISARIIHDSVIVLHTRIIVKANRRGDVEINSAFCRDFASVLIDLAMVCLCICHYTIAVLYCSVCAAHQHHR